MKEGIFNEASSLQKWHWSIKERYFLWRKKNYEILIWPLFPLHASLHTSRYNNFDVERFSFYFLIMKLLLGGGEGINYIISVFVQIIYKSTWRVINATQPIIVIYPGF